MAVILLAGGDAALLEGLAQSLGAAGHPSRLAGSASAATALAAGEPPLVAIVERRLLKDADVGAMRLRPGGAFIVYEDAAGGRVDQGAAAGRAPLPRAVQRHTLAEVALPLERTRVVALVTSVTARARAAGRERDLAPPSSAFPELRSR